MANIIIDPIEIMISGKVRVDVRDQNNNTKHFQRFNNIISDDLKNAIASAMQGNSAPAFITNAGSDWFSATYPNGTAQNGKDGILISQTAQESAGATHGDESGDYNWDILLNENVQSPAISTATVTWQSEATWLGTKGSGTATSGAVDKMQIGNSYTAHINQTSLSTAEHRQFDHFVTVFASADADNSSDFTAFTLDDNDIARVSWAITIA